MKSVIYYFSSTGNSMHVARELAKKTGNGNAIPITTFDDNKNGVIEADADIVGIVFPVYLHDTPIIVKKFVSRLRVNDKSYLFAVVTHNGQFGNSLGAVEKIFRKNGSVLLSGFDILMPGNSIIIRDYTNSENERNRRLRISLDMIDRIAASIIRLEKVHFVRKNSFVQKIQLFIIWILVRSYRMPRKLWTNEKCTRCGTCARVCPHGNIHVGENGVTWGNNCLMCLGCYHWCPQKAIELDTYSKEKLRYHHPDATLADMTLR
jgi:ferredoxin/flavodoxin